MNASDIPITQELLKRLLAAAPKDDDGRPVLTDAQFRRATFNDRANFSRVVFEGGPRFDGATFKGAAEFTEAIFKDTPRRAIIVGAADFDDQANAGITFLAEGLTSFKDAVFQSLTEFNRTAFHGLTEFHGAMFQRAPLFRRTSFHRVTTFGTATFEQGADFTGVVFQDDVGFRQATFKRETGGPRPASFDGLPEVVTGIFARATFQRSADLSGAIFEQVRQLGPILAGRSLVFDDAVFHKQVQIEVSAWAVCCRRARFVAGVQLRVRWAQVVLDEAALSTPSILAAAAGPFPALDEDRVAQIWRRLRRPHGIRDGRVQLVSLRRADVSGLTVANVDLHACRFTGAHHLDRLRLEEVGFAATPKGPRWTTRQTIAEEHHWRACRPRRNPIAGHDAAQHKRTARQAAGWYRPRHQPPAWLAVDQPTPAQVAALYRTLRKGREDNKDEPGAADFYYGEMEMRRQARRLEIRRERRREHRSTAAAAAIEYAILSAYWLVAGYGLRAWRALAALLVLIGLAGVGFSRVGFHRPHPAQLASWLYALQATVSLEGKARQLTGQLTLPGELLRVGLRLTGPVLLGLAVLSIRGRVKR